MTYNENKEKDIESLELKPDEAILKGNPLLKKVLERSRSSHLLRRFSVSGYSYRYDRTFQSMMLFGTGDPKVMAGGISQALVTTVLELVAAIPYTS